VRQADDFVLACDDLWEMGRKPGGLQTALMASPSALNFFGDDLSRQTVHVFTARSKNVNPMMAVHHGSIGPRLETMRLSEGEASFQFVARNPMERIEFTLDQARIGWRDLSGIT